MSFEIEKKHIRNELKAGVHLVMIHALKKHLDSNKNPIIVDGEIAVLVTFCTGTNPNQYHDQVYWIGKGKDGKEKYFTRMCIDAGIDMSKTPLTEKDAIKKRLWVGIREVFTLIKNGEEILKDVKGNPVIEHFIFQTAPIYDVDKAPTWKGDPAKNNGEAMDEFVGYKEEHESGYDTVKEVVASGPVIEVAAVTPEMEAAMSEEAIEKALSDVAQEVKPVLEKATQDLIVHGVAGVHVNEAGKATNVPVEKVLEMKAPAPNFGEPTLEVKETPVTQQDLKDILTPAPEVKKATPNFGDTPDTNF